MLGHEVEDKFTVDERTKVNQATEAVKQAQLALASADSTTERFQLWIELPNRERCGNDINDVTCLKNVQLDGLLKEMQQ